MARHILLHASATSLGVSLGWLFYESVRLCDAYVSALWL